MWRTRSMALVAALVLSTIGFSLPERTLAVPAVDAKIEVVWPHDEQGNEAPVATAPLVNVEVYLFERGTLNPVPKSFSNKVILHWARTCNPTIGWCIGMQEPARDTQVAQTSAVGQRIIKRVDGKTFPAWVFNDLSVLVPEDGEIWNHYFFIEVEGASYRTNVWAHGPDARSYLPNPYDPEFNVGTSNPSAVDAKINAVWPHDTQGNPRPITEAPLVNIGVDLGENRSIPYRTEMVWRSVGFAYNPTVRLLRSFNSGFLEPVKTADQITKMSDYARPFLIEWPRWVFNNIDVSAARDPLNKYYFAVQVDGATTHTTIWAHGADARTYFPQKDVPARSAAE